MGVTHMDHPFDLQAVKTGKDLLKFFVNAEKYLKTKAASVKIDGVNIPIKLINTGRKDPKTGESEKQFAADRGSLKPEDVQGITAANVHKRFKEGHGFIKMMPKALRVFDAAFSEIKEELSALGMLNDPTIYLNTEFVQAGGKTNVLQYKDPATGEPIDYSFIAIHNLGQFYQKETKIKDKMSRPGLERPIDSVTNKPILGAATEIPHDKSTMRSLVKKLNAVGMPFGFRVYGDVPTEKLDININFDEVLDEKIPIYINKDRPPEEKTLGQWLILVENPKQGRQTLTLKNNKVTEALNKELYLLIVEGKRYLEDLLLFEQDYEKAIAGAIIYHATRKLGQPVLDSLKSDLGSVVEHEGIVLRDEELFGPKPVKITGEFIVGGVGSQFRKVPAPGASEPVAPVEPPENVIGEDGEEVTSYVFIPGGFKPPHKGHLYLIKDAIKQAGDSKPYVITGEEARGGVTLEQSKEILDLYLANENIPTGFAKNELDVIRVPAGGAPVLGAKGEHLANKAGTPRYSNSPLQAIYNKCISLPQFSTVSIAASSADPDHGLIGQSIMEARPDLTVRNIEVTITKDFMDPKTGDKLSATVMRNALESGDFERFKDFVPESSKNHAGHIFSTILGGRFGEGEVEQEQKPFRSDDLYGMIDQELEEVSVAANVAGTAGPWKKKRKFNENYSRILKEQFIDEVANYLLKR